MKLYISEPELKEGCHVGQILVHDDENNDIAYFLHNEDATVPQSYETALAMARALVNAEEYRTALIHIRGSYTPDQPADSAADEVSWVMRHVGGLRRVAANALDHLGILGEKNV
jgi:hypothetical protein